MEVYHTIIHSNLSLIARIFGNLDMESKLHKGMFKKPNTKGMQSVFYSIMFVLNPDHCKKSVPWPISYASDTYKFRTAVIDFIKKECPDFEMPKLLPSLLNKADGNKYVKFVFDFVTYATKKIIFFKFGELLIGMPDINVCFEANLVLLDNLTVSIVDELKQNQEEHLRFIENSHSFSKCVQNNLMIKLKDFRTRKQILNAKLCVSGTGDNAATDIHTKERFFHELNQTMLQKKNQHDKLRTEIRRILEKQQYLLRLVNMKKMGCSDVLCIKEFNSCLDDNFSKAVKIPLSTAIMNLIQDRQISVENNNGIYLKSFLHYGKLVIDEHIKRLVTLNPIHKHLAVCKIVDDVSSNSTKRLVNLEEMSSKLDNVIREIQQKLGKLENQISQKNEAYIKKLQVEREYLFKLYDGYQPKRLIPIESCPILPTNNSFHEQIEDESIIMHKIKFKILASK